MARGTCSYHRDRYKSCRKTQFENDGFEIYIGDQADEDFLKKCLNEIGSYDILIDDGGHKLHQQSLLLFK